LVKRDVPGDEIGIITPYNAQANLIRQLLDASMEIHTIDKYQVTPNTYFAERFVINLVARKWAEVRKWESIIAHFPIYPNTGKRKNEKTFFSFSFFPFT